MTRNHLYEGATTPTDAKLALLDVDSVGLKLSRVLEFRSRMTGRLTLRMRPPPGTYGADQAVPENAVPSTATAGATSDDPSDASDL